MSKIGKFFDKYLHWHSCIITGFDGMSFIGKCKYCGKECLRDSQGNWFANEPILKNNKGDKEI